MKKATVLIILILAFSFNACNSNSKINPQNNAGSPDYPELRSNSTLSFKSEFNGNIFITDDSRYRYLKFGTPDSSVVQSQVSLSDNTKLLFHYLKASMIGLALFKSPESELNNILVIGLGGGSMPRFIKKCIPKIKIDSVDIDPVVVAVAKRYFFVNEDEDHRIFIQDGRKFVENSVKKYDLIFLDAFNAEDSIPRQLTSIEFLKVLRNCLSEKGLLILNFINYNQKIYQSIFKTYKESFKHVIRFNLISFGSGNIIIMAYDDDAKNLSADEIKKRISGRPDIFDADYHFKDYADTFNSDELSFTKAEIIHDR